MAERETVPGLKLRPCPFCGGEAKASRDWLSLSKPENMQCFTIRCTSCGVGFGWQSGNVARWNTRAETVEG
jgi:hypothetical protein